MVRKERTYINIHYFPKTALEVFRIVPLLCNGCCVFSERSNDARLDSLYEPYITFFNSFDELVGFVPNTKAEGFEEFKFGRLIYDSGCLQCFKPASKN